MKQFKKFQAMVPSDFSELMLNFYFVIPVNILQTI
jgi:hypothetical protein